MLRLPARYVTVAHTVIAASAFLSAFVVGSAGYYKKLCKNGVAGVCRPACERVDCLQVFPKNGFHRYQPRSYPLPGVSGIDDRFRIGDHLPPRIVFQILIALCSGPRFLLVFLQYIVHRTTPPVEDGVHEKPKTNEGRARILATIGIARTFTW